MIMWSTLTISTIIYLFICRYIYYKKLFALLRKYVIYLVFIYLALSLSETN